MPKKKKSKRRNWPYSTGKLHSGQILWAKSNAYIVCCDCGLRHHVVIDRETISKGQEMLMPNDKWLALRFYRDDRITAMERRQDKIKVLVRGKSLEE